MIDDFGHILHITRNFGLLQTPTVIFYYSIAYNWSSIVYHDNMIFQLSLFLDLRDISGQTHCFCFGTREIVVIILFTSASLFLYDGLQVRLHLRSGNTGKTYKTYMFIYSLAQKKKKEVHCRFEK